MQAESMRVHHVDVAARRVQRDPPGSRRDCGHAGESGKKIFMLARVLRDQNDPCHPGRAIGVTLKGWFPEILREMLLTDEKTGLWALRLFGEGKRECDRDRLSVRRAGLALEPKRFEVADTALTKRQRVGFRVAALEHQQRQSFALREEVAGEGAERRDASLGRTNSFRLGDGDQLNKHARKL